MLATAGGALVSKDELMTRLCPGRTVAENNLHVHISTLRKALDARGGSDSYVITVPGRGYRLAHLLPFSRVRRATCTTSAAAR